MAEITAEVPWVELRPLLEQVLGKLSRKRRSRIGRKTIDQVPVFETLGLRPLCKISIDQVEYQIRDRLSCTRFLGLGDRVTDGNTVWLYREALAQARIKGGEGLEGWENKPARRS